MAEDFQALYRALPSVDQLIASAFNGTPRAADHPRKVFAARLLLDRLRQQIAAGEHDASSLATEVEGLGVVLTETLADLDMYSLRPVINATGVILHTNLGRAPLSPSAIDHIAETSRGYCNLEFDLRSGTRGKREQLASERLLRLLSLRTGVPFPELIASHGVFVANNCAAAVFLTLHALAAGGDVLVSRGELIEIGGGFRVPEILARAGATLREVGTTNRTRIQDYEKAITDRTRLILRVHQSNFRVSGFTARPELSEVVGVGRRHNVPVVEDQGTGAFTALRPGDRSTFPTSLMAGTDVITASGDKLFGGPQAGLIVARRDLLGVIARNPLARAFRVDKLTCAALEATLLDYETAPEKIPVLNMMSLRSQEILCRAEKLVKLIRCQHLRVSIRPGYSVIGGGSAPGVRLRTHLLEISHRGHSASALLQTLRESNPPLIARIAKDQVLLDLRTVAPELDSAVVGILNSVPA